jgi:hypothetical protein
MSDDWDRILETFHRPWNIKRHARDLKTAYLKKQREAKEAAELGLKKGKR